MIRTAIYYILINDKLILKVIECSWDTFAKQLLQASSLDDIISAHNHFLDSVRHGTLLDEKSQVSIRSYL